MAISVTCTGVVRTNGKIYVRFADGDELEYESLQQAKDETRELRERAKDFLHQMLVAKFLHVNPDGSNPGSMVNKTMTIDLDLASNLVRIT